MSETTASAVHLHDAAGPHEGRRSAELPGIANATMLRALSFCVGFAFFVTAVGLWAFTAPDASVMLIKLGASILFLGGAAIFLLVAIAPHDFYRLEFDRRSGVLRVLERDASGRFFVQGIQKLSDIDRMRFQSGSLRAWSSEGEMVMSVPMRARHAKTVLRAVLATS